MLNRAHHSICLCAARVGRVCTRPCCRSAQPTVRHTFVTSLAWYDKGVGCARMHAHACSLPAQTNTYDLLVWVCQSSCGSPATLFSRPCSVLRGGAWCVEHCLHSPRGAPPGTQPPWTTPTSSHCTLCEPEARWQTRGYLINTFNPYKEEGNSRFLHWHALYAWWYPRQVHDCRNCCRKAPHSPEPTIIM